MAHPSVPTIIPTFLGYHHHGMPYFVYLSVIIYLQPHLGIEYWQYTNPESEETTRACAPDGEDPTCSASIPTGGINPAHWKVRLDIIFNFFFTHS